MTSIAAIQEGLRAFDTAARANADPAAIQTAWKGIFQQSMNAASAKSFSKYYKEMRSKTSRKNRRNTRRRMTGGAAPLNYTMTPGLPVNTYGQFPVEVDTDPASIKDLDVYFHDSLPLSKGGYWPTVPADMGSNQVGGRRRGSRSSRKTLKRRKMRGGSLLDTISMRTIPFNATPYPNAIQVASSAWSGATTPIPAPASPVQHTWTPMGMPGAPINPSAVTNISSDFSRLASPAPWQSTQ
jgi:hypothetical protein